MRLSAAIAIGILLLVMSASASTVRVQASPPPAPASVQVLFDLGDGFYEWTSVVIPDPVAWNATWNATLDAAADVGLWIRWSWYSFGGSGAVFITDVGNRSPPGGVGIYTWNTTSHAWDAALVGISSLVLSNGDALALYDAGFDPVTFGNQYPSPTPEHPHPATEFRGDFANSGWSASSAPSGVEVLWDRNLNLREIEGTPAVAAGRVVVLTQDGLFALDESSGAVLWSNPKVAGLSSPALFNGTLIVGGSDGKVHGIDATTGLERWNATLVRKPGPSGLTSSPKVVFDTVYIGVFNESGGPGEVDALWATNGTVIWRAPAPASVSFSTPAVAEGRVFVGVIGLYNTTTGVTYAPPYGVLALNATDGSELWFHPTSGSVAASPVVYGGRVYAAAKDGLLNCMRSVNGSLLWSASVQAGVSSPALSGDVLYVGGGTFGGTGRVVAINVSSGASVWTFLPNGPVQGSITRAGGEVLFSTNAANGTLYALDASTGMALWSFTTGGWVSTKKSASLVS